MKEKISYKLIKNYKDCPEIGSIESYDGGTTSTPIWRGTNYYESHSEYWQRVEEKEYEVIKYVIKSGDKTGLITYSLEQIGWFGCDYDIYSIKRISDNEIFTVGEEVSVMNAFGATIKIKNFVEENNGKLWVEHDDENSGGVTYLKNIKKVVKAKYPIINSFTDKESPYYEYSHKNNLYGYDYCFCVRLESMLHMDRCVDSGDFYISEVVISETETLKIGDKIEYIIPELKELIPSFIIDNFFLREDGMVLCRSRNCDNVADVMTVRKIIVEPKVSFVTEDGVTVFEDDMIYFLYFCCHKWQINSYSKFKDRMEYINDPVCKIFSSKYAAELFCLKEKMLSSFKEYNEDFSKYQNKLKEGK